MRILFFKNTLFLTLLLLNSCGNGKDNAFAKANTNTTTQIEKTADSLYNTQKTSKTSEHITSPSPKQRHPNQPRIIKSIDILIHYQHTRHTNKSHLTFKFKHKPTHTSPNHHSFAPQITATHDLNQNLWFTPPCDRTHFKYGAALGACKGRTFLYWAWPKPCAMRCFRQQLRSGRHLCNGL